MKISASKLRWLFRPHNAYLVSHAASALGWLVPSEWVIRKGFSGIEDWGALFALMLVVVTSFYASTAVFYHVGRSIDLGLRRATPYWLPHIDEGLSYALLTSLGLVGVVATYSTILRGLNGLENVVAVVRDGRANELKYALYENYKVGIASLRYVTILGGALAMYRTISRRSVSWLDLVNAVLLMLTAIISNRLAFVASLLVGLSIWVFNRASQRLQLRYALLAGFAIWILLGVFNHTRNYHYYLSLGSSGWAQSLLAELVTYLGSPFQGAVTALQHIAALEGDVGLFYRESRIEESLTTNSAIAELAIRGGWVALTLGCIIVWLAALLMGLISRALNTYLVLVYGVLLYCFSELWRVFLFDRGIVLTLLSAVFIVVGARLLIKIKPKSRLGRG